MGQSAKSGPTIAVAKEKGRPRALDGPAPRRFESCRGCQYYRLSSRRLWRFLRVKSKTSKNLVPARSGQERTEAARSGHQEVHL